ncbi:unnamed protein product [Brachionus calyciflorus]|uniref:Uncharacterized protein n=1 Tax=Brachionus calyciflorus TaxID=104777 RepID=A0A814Q5W2_9BILA|nr:unnamed protein product [Brachionus calyciflorus]
MDYFEKQWIEKIKPEIWNHHESDIQTNNKIEGFHSALNKLVKTNHPNIFHLIFFLKQHQSSVLVEYEHLKQAQVTTKKSKKDQDKELRLELIKREHK